MILHSPSKTEKTIISDEDKIMKEENGKILGVIGGMGPLATQLFYRMVIESTDAGRDQDHINMIILNHATMPDRTTAIMDGTIDKVLDKLAADAQYLVDGGATCIAIPCNTTHAVLDKLQERVSIPIINMVKSTAEYVSSQVAGPIPVNEHSNSLVQPEKHIVGIMATSGTIKMELYQNACRQFDLEPVVPSPEKQELVMKMIYDGVKNGGPVSFEDFESVAGELQDMGAEKIILGCTELSVIRELFSLRDFYVDAMQVLTDRAIELCR